MEFKDKSVIVTGASVGIGRDTAILFAAQGAKVVVNYLTAEKDAAATVDAIARAGGTAIPCQGDVALDADARRIVDTAVKRFGRLDILVNNAGTTAFIPFDDLDSAQPEVWLRLYNTNVVGAFLCSRAAVAAMKKTGGGVIVNVASIAGHKPSGSSIPYCSSKAALLHMTKCLAKTVGPDIRVCSVSPGVIEDTRWNAGRKNFDPVAAHNSAVDSAVIKRAGTAKDISAAILFMASDKASFCTGNDLLVDGGRQIGDSAVYK